MKAVEFVLGFLNLCQCEFAFKFKFGSETDPLRLHLEVNQMLAIKDYTELQTYFLQFISIAAWEPC